MKHTVESIIESVAYYYGIQQNELMVRSRKMRVVHARNVALYIIKKRLWYQYIELLSLFPNLYSDHTGFVRACNKITAEISLPKIYPTDDEIATILVLSLQKNTKEVA